MNKREEVFQRVVEYLQGIVREQQEIIRQLSGEDLGYTYIHPRDVFYLVENVSPPDMMDIITIDDPAGEFIIIGDVKYKQSMEIPAKHKEIA